MTVEARLLAKDNARKEILLNVLQFSRAVGKKRLTRKDIDRLLENVPQFRDALIEFLTEDEALDRQRLPSLKPGVAEIVRENGARRKSPVKPARPQLRLVKG